ncbi:phage tail sheath subtilisin-like domain-containing protein [Leptothoe sp. PORK10 BA2]|uniref:phage tail sheath subtilisin-like domain-containing protein n=1 Tax=Leptothoe sp. PORK10 BA2 TaxID=3110254 RepID=UPI002B20052D|nr:phage tail sheath subtilisin-like domain-containing protein [Leptothoe sp. PORK10 BA2]MEA5463914.1 phage tail sheath subtilisin-like domain-containing protein [Leptothoe sp. PORK10 BA2]
MPEYLAPGVYVEETSFRARSIEGVSTSTAGFVGLTRRGPVADPDSGNPLDLLTSFGDFERIYGGLDNLTLGGNSLPNYLAHAVRAFFNEGGARLYVSRVYVPPAAGDGQASFDLNADGSISVEARFPGSTYDGQVSFRESEAPASAVTLNSAPTGTLLKTTAAGADSYFIKAADGSWRNSGNTTLTLPLPAGTTANFVTLSILTTDTDGNELSYDNLGFSPAHPLAVNKVLSAAPAKRSDFLQNLYAIELGATVSGFDLRTAIFGDAALLNDGVRTVALSGGSDGREPTQAAFEAALRELANVEDISIVAAPGYSAFAQAQGIQGALIAHAERRRAYRIAVLDTAAELSITEARASKSQIDSRYAALYYPWVTVVNPLSRPGDAGIPAEINLPPSGFIAGIYARNDVERGVFKAPANEVVRGAIRFEREVNFAEQEALNPFGVNCLRFFPGRGYRVWGARTTSSDPEWKYVNIRRYFNYLEQSIDRGTQWAVFEPNGPQLWTNVRDTVSSFLYNEWVSGALLGNSPAEAFFVRCDRSTMTQNDLDNGRLICLIGVAAVKPAEFVIFRIGQKTSDASN